MKQDPVARLDVAQLAIVLFHLDLRANQALLHLGHGPQVAAERNLVRPAGERDEPVADRQILACRSRMVDLARTGRRRLGRLGKQIVDLVAAVGLTVSLRNLPTQSSTSHALRLVRDRRRRGPTFSRDNQGYVRIRCGKHGQRIGAQAGKQFIVGAERAGHLAGNLLVHTDSSYPCVTRQPSGVPRRTTLRQSPTPPL